MTLFLVKRLEFNFNPLFHHPFFSFQFCKNKQLASVKNCNIAMWEEGVTEIVKGRGLLFSLTGKCFTVLLHIVETSYPRLKI